MTKAVLAFEKVSNEAAKANESDTGAKAEEDAGSGGSVEVVDRVWAVLAFVVMC